MHLLIPDTWNYGKPFSKVDLTHDVACHMSFESPIIIPGHIRNTKNRAGWRISVHLIEKFVSFFRINHQIHSGSFVIHVTLVGLIVFILPLIKDKCRCHRAMTNRVSQPICYTIIGWFKTVIIIIQTLFIVLPFFSFILSACLKFNIHIVRDPPGNSHINICQILIFTKIPWFPISSIASKLI